MSKVVCRTLALFAVLAGGTSLAEAQATRTWVSGVGDDANPCSRTAPCKTFAGAISKTAAGGEINVIDQGAYGAVTITKSISIVGDGQFAGVLTSGGANAINVTAGANDVVVLRGLDLHGLGSAQHGIRFNSGAQLHVENCQIHAFTGKGIDVLVSTTGAHLFVRDTVIRNNAGANAGGIALAGTGAGSISATLDRVRLVGNRFGLRADATARAMIRNSEATGNNTNGFIATAGSVGLFLEGSIASDNTNNGILVGVGPVVRISNSIVTGNGTGLNGSILSFGNNRIGGNGVDGGPPAVMGQQ
jgi:hypothetical protein